MKWSQCRLENIVHWEGWLQCLQALEKSVFETKYSRTKTAINPLPVSSPAYKNFGRSFFWATCYIQFHNIMWINLSLFRVGPLWWNALFFIVFWLINKQNETICLDYISKRFLECKFTLFISIKKSGGVILI